MNKIGFAMSAILVVIGIVTLLQTAIINLVMPMIGRAAFQCAMSGSYTPDDYRINFLFVNAAAICLLAAGLYLAYRFYRADK